MLESYKNIIVSNGTHRIEDLARAFYEPICVLCYEAQRQCNKKAYMKCTTLQYDLEQIHKFYDCTSWFNLNKEDPEKFIDVINEVFDTLDTYAPTGYYFGTLEVDGACFGFWPLSGNEEYNG